MANLSRTQRRASVSDVSRLVAFDAVAVPEITFASSEVFRCTGYDDVVRDLTCAAASGFELPAQTGNAFVNSQRKWTTQSSEDMRKRELPEEN